MNDNDVAQGHQTTVERRAIAWFVTMRGDHAASDQEAFRAWMSESEEHRRAYEWIEMHYEQAAVLKGMVSEYSDAPRRSKIAVLALAAAAAAAVVVVARDPILRFATGHNDAISDQKTVSYRSAHGEIREIQLDPGLSVTLDTDSRLILVSKGSERRLDLHAGKARFRVMSPMPGLIVGAGAGDIRAKSATFDVGYDPRGRVVVSMVNGAAEMTPRLRPAIFSTTARTRLQGGQVFRYPAAHYRPVSVVASGLDWRDWPNGWVESRRISLEALVEQANRYAKQPIWIDDVAIANIAVTGRFRLTNTDGFIARIVELFDLRAEQRSDGLHLSQNNFARD